MFKTACGKAAASNEAKGVRIPVRRASERRENEAAGHFQHPA
jgi:hypothetical protein